MTDSMGTFRIDIELENPGHRGPRRHVPGLLVDTGSELSWVPGPILESLLIERIKTKRFRQASGAVVERWTGEVRVHAAGTVTPDEVVFGEPDDLALRVIERHLDHVEPVQRVRRVRGIRAVLAPRELGLREPRCSKEPSRRLRAV